MSNTSRREFLRRSAAAGAIAWAAPTILTKVPAQAQVGSPVCDCNADAAALVVRLGTGTIGPFGTPGNPCVQNVNQAGIVAAILCGSTSSTAAACTAEASVAQLNVAGIQVVAASSSVTAPCDCSPPVGTSTVASLVVHGQNIPIPPGCNAHVITNLGVNIYFNEQVCEGNTLVVRALRIEVTGLLHIVLAESRASAGNCPCVACS